MRAELTTAENFLNLIKLKTLEVNHNSVYNFNHAAIREFNKSQSDAKLIQFTKHKNSPSKRMKQ